MNGSCAQKRETHPELVFSIIDAMRNADDSHDPESDTPKRKANLKKL